MGGYVFCYTTKKETEIDQEKKKRSRKATRR